ncbi:hypothetical protein N7475_002337 [Penicillium sp. IBT 31633x]|nr:hypothetical protein N7475_002337 [Penicillium sp. IBT 31633x]
MNVTAEKLDITMGPDANGTTASTNRDDDVTDEKEEEHEQRKSVLKLKEVEEEAARGLNEGQKRKPKDSMNKPGCNMSWDAGTRRIPETARSLSEARRKEEADQRKLRTMEICVEGFQWIKQSGGYRCAGGNHWVLDAQLGNS